LLLAGVVSRGVLFLAKRAKGKGRGGMVWVVDVEDWNLPQQAGAEPDGAGRCPDSYRDGRI